MKKRISLAVIICIIVGLMGNFSAYAQDVNILTLGRGTELYDVVYGNNQYVAIGTKDGKSIIMLSQDGEKFEEVKLKESVSFYKHSFSIIYHTPFKMFMIIDASDNTSCIVSSDGVNWARKSLGYSIYTLYSDGVRITATADNSKEVLISETKEFPLEWKIQSGESKTAISSNSAKFAMTDGKDKNPSVVKSTFAEETWAGYYCSEFGETYDTTFLTHAWFEPAKIDGIYFDGDYVFTAQNKTFPKRKIQIISNDGTNSALSRDSSKVDGLANALAASDEKVILGTSTGKLYGYSKELFKSLSMEVEIPTENTKPIVAATYGNGKFVVITADSIISFADEVVKFEQAKDFKMISENSQMFLFVGSPVAYVDNYEMFLDNESKDVVPTTSDGRTLVPIRFISENFGYEVEFDSKSGVIDIANKDSKIQMTIGKKEIKINSEKFPLDVAPSVVAGRTLVPIRAVSEAFNKKVTWDNRGLIGIHDDIINNKQMNKYVKILRREVLNQPKITKTIELNTKDYGIIPGAEIENSAKIRELVDKAMALVEVDGVAVNVNFEPNEIYYLDPQYKRFENIFIRDSRNITIDGHGSEVRVHPDNLFLGIYDSDNIHIQNFKIDYSPIPYLQGTVTDINGDEGTFTFTLHDSSPDPGRFKFFDHGSFVSSETGLYTNMWAYITSFTEISAAERKYQITVRADQKNVLTDARLKNGDYFWCYNWYFESGEIRNAMNEKGDDGEFISAHTATITVKYSNDCSVQNIDQYASPRMGLRTDGSDDLYINNYNIMRRPGTDRIVACSSDGVHGRSRSGPIIENSSFEALGDDSISIGDMGHIVKEVLAPDTLKLQYRDIIWFKSWLKAGDELVFHDIQGKSEIGRAKIVACYVKNQVTIVKLDKVIKGLAPEIIRCRTVPVKPINVISCDFKSQLKEAILAGSSYNIENCTFNDLAYGVHLSESLIGEISIKNNTFGSTWPNIISVQGWQLGDNTSNLFKTKIIIKDNVLNVKTNKANNYIYVTSYEDVVIEGNTINIPDFISPKGKNVIRVRGGKNVLIKDNIINDARPAAAGDLIVTTDVKADDVILENNIINKK